MNALLETGLPAALVVAIVAGIRKMMPAPQPALSMLIAGVISLIVSAAYDLMVVRFIDWAYLPMDTIITWAAAMGFWSGGKAALGK